MLEVKTYSKAELSDAIHCNPSASNQSIKSKLERWGVEFTTVGRGQNIKFSITHISNRLKVYSLTELGARAEIDFTKFRNFLFYFFNNDEFRTMPDEVKENRMRDNKKPISRQTIKHYEDILINNHLFDRSTSEFIYYFALGTEQLITDKATYNKAWKEYFADLDADEERKSITAIENMIANYGGVARKQGIMETNAIYESQIEYINGLVFENLYKEIEGKQNQPINTNE